MTQAPRFVGGVSVDLTSDGRHLLASFALNDGLVHAELHTSTRVALRLFPANGRLPYTAVWGTNGPSVSSAAPVPEILYETPGSLHENAADPIGSKVSANHLTLDIPAKSLRDLPLHFHWTAEIDYIDYADRSGSASRSTCPADAFTASTGLPFP